MKRNEVNLEIYICTYELHEFKFLIGIKKKLKLYCIINKNSLNDFVFSLSLHKLES